jgi:hypothetical protein
MNFREEKNWMDKRTESIQRLPGGLEQHRELSTAAE